ncbi:MAG: hypothetical protein JOY80_03780, partial [Candidatus Dormibacteraeota bacterium]|nr:hypothetical protein [Candidatus Dormibacteraeota bacterium]
MTRRFALSLVVLLALSGCAGATASTPSSLTFRTGSAPALASTTLSTSPDGGIYKNPDPLSVLLLSRESGDAVITELGGAASSWSSLTSLGDFTFVGLQIRNDGAAGSDPELNAVQIASDFAPDGTATGALRHFYHPMFPLAMISVQASDANCSLHLEPGASVVAVLMYPPIRATQEILWGVYQAFAVRAR